MDILLDKPVYGVTQEHPDPFLHLEPSASYSSPSYVTWLGLPSGKERPPILQLILVCTLEAQLSPNQFRAWLCYPWRVLTTITVGLWLNVVEAFDTARSQIKESYVFYPKGKQRNEISLPRHGIHIY
jgi:hypothetical protein